MSEKLLEEIERRLNAKTIHDLRQVARAVGVPRPADGRKERILEYIIQIASGESDPVAPAVRGAHPKSAEYDRQLVSDILKCREISLSAKGASVHETMEMSVASGAESDPYEFTAEGILEKSDGRWFMRVNGCRENFISDIFVNEYFIKSFCLREGDLICGVCKRETLEEIAGLVNLRRVNGVSPDNLQPRNDFDKLSPVYPERRLKTANGANDVSGRIIDLLSPVGAGQRAAVIAPHGAGKTAMLKNIARGILANNAQVKVIILLVDARPEEAADFRRSFPDTDVFTSSFDAGAASHVRTAKLALEYAKRLTESNLHTVLILDDLTRLTRAYNYCGKQAASVLDTAALDGVKKFLSAAKNTEESGSLTIISALSNGGDAVDEAVYSGLKDVCNMRITLSLQLARARVAAPIDIEYTVASGDERLLSPDELKAAVKLRGENIFKITELIESTSSNEELCKKLLK